MELLFNDFLCFCIAFVFSHVTWLKDLYLWNSWDVIISFTLKMTIEYGFHSLFDPNLSKGKII